MSFKSDMDVQSRRIDKTLCRLCIKTKGIPHMSSDGRNMSVEFMACISYLFAGCPFVRLSGRVDTYWTSDRMMFDYESMCMRTDITPFDCKNNAEGYFYFLFYMQCDEMDVEMSSVFVKYIHRAACDIVSGFDGCLFISAAFGLLSDNHKDFGNIMYVPKDYKKFGDIICTSHTSFDLWKMFHSSVIVSAVTNGCSVGRHLCNTLDKIEGTKPCYDIIAAYICNTFMPMYNHDSDARKYDYYCEVVNVFDSKHYIYAVWQKRQHSCYVCVVYDWLVNSCDLFNIHLRVFRETDRDVKEALEYVSRVCYIRCADARNYVKKAFEYANTMYVRNLQLNSLNCGV